MCIKEIPFWRSLESYSHLNHHPLYKINWLNIIINKMLEEEETAEERRERWMEKEAAKAEEGGRKEKIVTHAKCAKCGKEVEEGEGIEVRGIILCADCYEDELEADMDMGAAEGAGAG